MKKLILILTVLLSLLGCTTVFAAQTNAISFSFNGESRELSAPPSVSNDTLMVPAVDLIEMISGYIDCNWNEETKTALIKTSHDRLLQITAGKNEITVLKRVKKSDSEHAEVLLFQDDTRYTVLNRITLETAAVIHNGKMMIPVSFLQSYYKDYAALNWDKNKNRLDLHTTTYMGYTIPLIKVDSQENRISAKVLSELLQMRQESVVFYGFDYFDLTYFTADFGGVKNGNGTVTLIGKEYPERVLQMTVHNGIATAVTDNLQTLERNSDQEEGAITENAQYTEFLSDRFRIRIYSEQEIQAGSEITARAEVMYIGPNEKFYFRHSDPYFTLSLSGGKYELSGMINDVSIQSVLKKGETYAFKLMKGGAFSDSAPDADEWRTFYSTPEIILPKGEYTIGGHFEGQNMHDGKSFTATVNRKITVN